MFLIRIVPRFRLIRLTIDNRCRVGSEDTVAQNRCTWCRTKHIFRVISAPRDNIRRFALICARKKLKIVPIEGKGAGQRTFRSRKRRIEVARDRTFVKGPCPKRDIVDEKAALGSRSTAHIVARKLATK